MDALLQQLKDFRTAAASLKRESDDFRALAVRLRAIEEAAKDQDVPLALEERFDLGCGFTCSAVIPDPSHVRLQLGVDDIVGDFPLLEATAYSDKRADLLARRAEAKQKEADALAAELKALAVGIKQSMDKMLGPSSSVTA